MKNLPRYTTAFWASYVFCMAWAIIVALLFYIYLPENPNLVDTGTIEAALSKKLSSRRLFALLLGAFVISVLLFTNNKYFDKVMIFLAAWMWAAYIDDYLVMHRYAYYPEEFMAQFVIKLRPLVVMLVSWMALESHLRKEAAA